jgi:hypothetical protein
VSWGLERQDERIRGDKGGMRGSGGGSEEGQREHWEDTEGKQDVPMWWIGMLEESEGLNSEGGGQGEERREVGSGKGRPASTCVFGKGW